MQRCCDWWRMWGSSLVSDPQVVKREGYEGWCKGGKKVQKSNGEILEGIACWPYILETWDIYLRHGIFTWDLRYSLQTWDIYLTCDIYLRPGIFTWDLGYLLETWDIHFRLEIFTWDLGYLLETWCFYLRLEFYMWCYLRNNISTRLVFLYVFLMHFLCISYAFLYALYMHFLCTLEKCMHFRLKCMYLWSKCMHFSKVHIKCI